MKLTERERELGELSRQADDAVAGRGGITVVSGESGVGKTAFVEAFVEQRSGRVLWGACDPLATPRPLGPIRDLGADFSPAVRALLRDGDQAHEIYDAVFGDLAAEPTLLVIDDLHWADQGSIELLRFVLRRIGRTNSLVVTTIRDDEVGAAHPLRPLLGDIARAPHGRSIVLPPLSLAAVASIVGDRPLDAARLHQVTGGNAFFVTAMLDHPGDELPATVRDAILERTVGLDAAAWDLLHLLVCAPGPIPDHLLSHVGVGMPALQTLADAKLITRSERGVAFRHDLCRLAVADVMPPGAHADLHRRMLVAYDAVAQSDSAVVTHHALGAGDRKLVSQAAFDAARTAARAGAHTQAAEFYRIALERGLPPAPDTEAALLERLAEECYLVDRLDDAIAASRRAIHLRAEQGVATALSAGHHALAVYQWYNASRADAEDHAAQAMTALDGVPAAVEAEVQLGHAIALQAYLAVHANDLARADALLAHAREIVSATGDSALDDRVALITGYCGVLRGDDAGRDSIVSIVLSAPEHLDEIHSSGFSNLTYLDVEQRRFKEAADVLAISLPLTVERDLPICRAWQLGSRGRCALLRGDWDDALADADAVLDRPSAPLTRTWPNLVRALVLLRRDSRGAAEIDEAWRLARRSDEAIRMLPAAAAVAEQAWLSGNPDDRIETCRAMLAAAPVTGLEWVRGELAAWLRRLDPEFDTDGVAPPYRLLLDGSHAAAADAFEQLSTPYDAALARTDSGDATLARRALDTLDRLGATAVAGKVRRDLRAGGVGAVPQRRRTATLANPVGLTNRQVEVLRLLADGATNAELARRLYLSIKTVDHHVSAILTKLPAANRRDAVRRARELGLI